MRGWLGGARQTHMDVMAAPEKHPCLQEASAPRCQRGESGQGQASPPHSVVKGWHSLLIPKGRGLALPTRISYTTCRTRSSKNNMNFKTVREEHSTKRGPG